MRTKKGESFELHESFVCAGGSPKGGDTCEGDGGGPLVCPAKGSGGDRYIQVIDQLIIDWDSSLRLLNIIHFKIKSVFKLKLEL